MKNQSKVDIVKLTEKKIVTTEIESRNGLTFMRTRSRGLRRK